MDACGTWRGDCMESSYVKYVFKGIYITVSPKFIISHRFVLRGDRKHKGHSRRDDCLEE